MCYICEARGTVGKDYKAAQKEIAAALRAWHNRGNKASGWVNPVPASQRLWTNKELKEYGEEWRREHSLP